MVQRLAILAGMSAAMTVCAQPASDTLTRDGVERFEAAYEAWDAAGFIAAAELFRRASTNAPTNSINFYWQGVAQFHLMLQLEYAPGSETNKTAIEDARETALDALVIAVKLNQKDAESHALLGTLFGMKIGGNLFRAARLGPRVMKHQKRALEYGKDDPRVQYLLGMGQFHTAKKNKGWEEALATLETAEKLYEKESQTEAGPLDPRWGWSSCLTFIGRCHELLGQPAKAAEYYRKALQLHPADHVAQAGLQRVMNAQ